MLDVISVVVCVVVFRVVVFEIGNGAVPCVVVVSSVVGAVGFKNVDVVLTVSVDVEVSVVVVVSVAAVVVLV